MPRYIDAKLFDSKLSIAIGDLDKQYITSEVVVAMKLVDYVLDNTPTADVVEVRHGRWVFAEDNFSGHYSCSICGATGICFINYCPWCGAKMDLKGEKQ